MLVTSLFIYLQLWSPRHSVWSVCCRRDSEMHQSLPWERALIFNELKWKCFPASIFNVFYIHSCSCSVSWGTEELSLMSPSDIHVSWGRSLVYLFCWLPQGKFQAGFSGKELKACFHTRKSTPSTLCHRNLPCYPHPHLPTPLHAHWATTLANKTVLALFSFHFTTYLVINGNTQKRNVW